MELAEQIIGTWQLVSYQVELQATGEFIDAMGDHPRGRVILQTMVGLPLTLRAPAGSRRIAMRNALV